MGPLKHVMITVTPPGQVDVVPPRANVSKKGQEEVCWHSPQCPCTIVFPKESPFFEIRFQVPKGGSVASGQPVNGVPGKVYKYNVVCTIDGDPRSPYIRDPEVEVDD